MPFSYHIALNGMIFRFLLSSLAISPASAQKLDQLTFANNNLVNVSGQDFYRFLRSKDPQEKERAQMYMVGVWDSTEGKTWCESSQYKSITLQETVHGYFKRLPEARLGERASKLIEEALVKNHPCKAKK